MKRGGSRGTGQRAGSNLTERVAVKRSPVHGRGLFAKRRFRPGAFIASFEGKGTATDGTHVLWISDEEGREVGIRGHNELRFLNHSSDPNAAFWGLDLYAIRNIQPDVELTFHYGEAWEDVE
jgi:SET domain-containing protein